MTSFNLTSNCIFLFIKIRKMMASTSDINEMFCSYVLHRTLSIFATYFLSKDKPASQEDQTKALKNYCTGLFASRNQNQLEQLCQETINNVYSIKKKSGNKTFYSSIGCVNDLATLVFGHSKSEYAVLEPKVRKDIAALYEAVINYVLSFNNCFVCASAFSNLSSTNPNLLSTIAKDEKSITEKNKDAGMFVSSVRNAILNCKKELYSMNNVVENDKLENMYETMLHIHKEMQLMSALAQKQYEFYERMYQPANNEHPNLDIQQKEECGEEMGGEFFGEPQLEGGNDEEQEADFQ
jgi:hypothetical protein